MRPAIVDVQQVRDISKIGKSYLAVVEKTGITALYEEIMACKNSLIGFGTVQHWAICFSRRLYGRTPIFARGQFGN